MFSRLAESVTLTHGGDLQHLQLLRPFPAAGGGVVQVRTNCVAPVGAHAVGRALLHSLLDEWIRRSRGRVLSDDFFVGERFQPAVPASRMDLLRRGAQSVVLLVVFKYWNYLTGLVFSASSTIRWHWSRSVPAARDFVFHVRVHSLRRRSLSRKDLRRFDLGVSRVHHVFPDDGGGADQTLRGFSAQAARGRGQCSQTSGSESRESWRDW